MKSFVKHTLLCLSLLFAAQTAGAAALAEEEYAVSAGRHGFTLSETQKRVDDQIATYRNTYDGITFTQEDYEYIRNQELSVLVTQCLMDNLVEDYGLESFTEEDRASLMQQAQDTYDKTVDYYLEQEKSGSEDQDAEKEKIRQFLTEQGVTVDGLYEKAVQYEGYNRLYEKTTDGIEATDEQVRQYFETNYIEADRKLFEGHADQYEKYTSVYGKEAYYVPEGYRVVRHILLALPEEIKTELENCSAKKDAVQKTLDGLRKAETPDEHGISLAEAELGNLENEYQTILAGAVPALQDKIDEIMGKVTAGSAFAELVSQYTSEESPSESGVMVHKDSVVYDTAYRDAAMALENAGDISAPVPTAGGVYLIQYAGEAKCGPAELTEELYPSIAEEASNQLKSDAFQKAVEEWAKTYPPKIETEKITLPE